jgi:hypothetical protein
MMDAVLEVPCLAGADWNPEFAIVATLRLCPGVGHRYQQLIGNGVATAASFRLGFYADQSDLQPSHAVLTLTATDRDGIS